MEIEVPTLYGDTKLKVPAGSQVKLMTPGKLSKRQRQLFEELAEGLDSNDKKKK
jgi:DnaJ-class molecular chaperone